MKKAHATVFTLRSMGNDNSFFHILISKCAKLENPQMVMVK